MIHWRKPWEWASKLYEWVDGSGQVDSVLTLYELREGDVTMGTGAAHAYAHATLAHVNDAWQVPQGLTALTGRAPCPALHLLASHRVSRHRPRFTCQNLENT
jgi:hypothetical protein